MFDYPPPISSLFGLLSLQMIFEDFLSIYIWFSFNLLHEGEWLPVVPNTLEHQTPGYPGTQSAVVYPVPRY